MKKNTFSLAGHKFTLKNIQYGIHSDETVDYMAELYCDGKRLCSCENDGRGGSTFTRRYPETSDEYFKVLEDVGKEVWLRCQTGDVIYYNLGTVADEVLVLVELNKEVARLQRDALVLQRSESYELHTRKLGATVKIYVQDYPGTLSKLIADMQDQGWEVLNTNIPKRIYEGAKEWRLSAEIQ